MFLSTFCSFCKSFNSVCGFVCNTICITNADNITDIADIGKNLFIMYNTYYKNIYLLEEIIINLQMR